MNFIEGFDRNQLQMVSFDQFVKADSWARIVDLFVDSLPIKELGFKTELAEQGRPPYQASDLLKLYLYGYRSGIRSSRKLAHACQINMEVIWLLKGLSPSARKIAYFRKNNPTAFKKAFRYFVMILKDLQLIDGQTIAIDSFKIRAQNSLKNNFNQKKIDRHIDYIVKNRLKSLVLNILAQYNNHKPVLSLIKTKLTILPKILIQNFRLLDLNYISII
jgi:transposase